MKNLLICDERGEISAGEIGNNCDVMKFADKSTAFQLGIRAMRPDMIITDELSTKDIPAIERVMAAGICVLASAHFASMDSLTAEFKGVFERYVLLSSERIGEIMRIYDKAGKEI